MVYTPRSRADFAVSYCFNLEAGTGVIHVRFSGELSDATVMEAYPEIRRAIAAHHVHAAILDFTAVSAFCLSAECTASLGRQPSLFPGPAPRVIVAPEDLIYSISTICRELGGNMRGPLSVARSLEEAYELLAQSGDRSPA